MWIEAVVIIPKSEVARLENSALFLPVIYRTFGKLTGAMKFPDGRVTLKQPFPIEVGDEFYRQPELKLWAVCLSQAIAGAVGLIRCNDLKCWRGPDRYWLIRDKRRVVGSCNWVCEVLQIDRKRLITFVWKNRHVLRKNPYRLRSMN